MTGRVRPATGEAACCRVRLATEVDEAGFRVAARRLISEGIPPDRVLWTVGDNGTTDLFDGEDSRPPGAPPQSAAGSSLRVPPAYAELTGWVLLHRDPQRFGLLYALLWRLQHEPAMRDDPLDRQWLQAQQMASAVRRDLHKMKAFVRFRTVARGADQAAVHVAWFEPGHHIVERAAPFFMRRFANMHWSVMTPLRTVAWDGEQLRFGDGARRDQAPPADAGEALWLTYCEHIFNPARLKLAMMRKEMPPRYWPNLPEAALIGPLSIGAHERNQQMIDRPATAPRPGRRLRGVRTP